MATNDGKKTKMQQRTNLTYNSSHPNKWQLMTKYQFNFFEAKWRKGEQEKGFTKGDKLSELTFQKDSHSQAADRNY